MATPLQPLYYAGHMREHRGDMCRAHSGGRIGSTGLNNCHFGHYYYDVRRYTLLHFKPHDSSQEKRIDNVSADVSTFNFRFPVIKLQVVMYIFIVSVFMISVAILVTATRNCTR